MSRISSLIDRLCPNGVEFKPIGGFGELVRGNGMPKTDFAETGVGCIHYGQIYTYYGVWATETKSFVPTEKAAKLAKVHHGDLIITNTSENMADVCKAVAWLGEDEIVTGGHATVLKHDQDPKYLSYYLQTSQFFAEKKKHATGTKVIDVSAKSLAKIRIPVPPLEVQQEIVSILDKFIKLEAELEAELEARSRQFLFYRSKLLNFREQYDFSTVGKTTLGEVCLIKTGQPINKIEISQNPGSFPVINSGREPLGFFNKYNTEDDPIGITSRGAGVGSITWREGKYYRGNLNYSATIKNPDLIMVRYLYHWLMQKQPAVKSLCSYDGIPALNKSNLETLEILIPPLEEQARIVAILDQFDEITSSLSSGLPAEIAARRRQYAYYRDRLLTFKEAA